jgi:phasin family protein
MRQAATPNYFSFVSELMDQFRFPELDYAAMLEARRKDFDALTEINRIGLKGLETVAVKQAKVVRTSLEDLRLVMKQLRPSGGSGKGASSNKAIQETLQRAFKNIRELANAAQKPQSEMFEVVTTRVQENIGQLKELVRPRQ